MPKSGDNARPYNRNEKRLAARNKSVRAKVAKSGGGKEAFMTAGPGRMAMSAGAASQMTRSTAKRADEALAAQMRAKPKPKPKPKPK